MNNIYEMALEMLEPVEEGMFDALTKSKIDKALHAGDWKKANHILGSSLIINKTDRKAYLNQIKKLRSKDPDYIKYEKGLTSLKRYISSQIKSLLRKYQKIDATRIRKNIDGRIHEFFKNNGSEDVNCLPKEYIPYYNNKMKLPEFCFKIFEETDDEFNIIVCDEEQNIRSEVGFVLNNIVKELESDKKIQNSEYEPRFNTGDGDEGIIYITFKEFK